MASALLVAAAALAAAPPAGAEVRRITLQEAIDLALAGNRTLADAVDRAAAAGYQLEAAAAEFELRLAPAARIGTTGRDGTDEQSVAIGVTLSRRTEGGARFEAEPSISRTGETHRGGVEARYRQPLLRGRGREAGRALLDAAEYGMRSVRRALHAREVDTVLAAVSALYAAVRERELLRLGEESAARLRGHAEAARVKERMGLADPIDAYRAAIQVKAAEDALTLAREAHRDALDTLKVTLALPLGLAVEPDAPLAWDSPDVGEEEAVAAARAGRVELAQADDAVREAERRSRLAANALLPELGLALTYARFGEGTTLGDGLALDHAAWGAALESTTTLGRPAETAARRQSLLDVAAARRARELLRDEIERQVRREHRALRRARERSGLQEEQIRQARGQLELARVKFRHGLADNFAVIEAELELRRAETSLVAAAVEQIVGSWRLRAAIGTLVERPGDL